MGCGRLENSIQPRPSRTAPVSIDTRAISSAVTALGPEGAGGCVGAGGGITGADGADQGADATEGGTEGGTWLTPGAAADQAAAARGTTRDQALADQAAKIPLGRLAEPEEIADVVVFLCSERVANVTGAAWSVDGGAVPVVI